MFSKVSFSFRIILGIDRTDVSVFIFHCQRVGGEAETERKTEEEREKKRERKTLYLGYLLNTNFSTTRNIPEWSNQGKSLVGITHPTRPQRQCPLF